MHINAKDALTSPKPLQMARLALAWRIHAEKILIFLGKKAPRAPGVKSGVLDFLSLSRFKHGTDSEHFADTLTASIRAFHDHSEFISNPDDCLSRPLIKLALARCCKEAIAV